MDFKFIVLALVISLTAVLGESAKKIESPIIGTNEKLTELNTTEELPNAKDHVTSEKLTHDVTNIAEGKPKDLSHKPVIDIHKSSANAVMADNGTVTDPPTPASIPASTPAPKHAPTSASTPVPKPAPKTTTSTTTSSTITIPKPMIALVPEEGNWTVNDSNTVCIVMRTEIEFNITYPGNTDSKYNKTIYVPKNATATGHCGSSNQNITLEWDLGNFFEISFTSNKSAGKFHINLFNLTINTTDFENIKDGVKNLTFVSTKPQFPDVPLKMSYRCDKQLKQKLQSSDNKFNATLLVSHTQFEAFTDNKTVFGEVKDCDEFDTPDIVPIAVGCVLSILVLIVLAAYLIGRRRSQSRGYLSM